MTGELWTRVQALLDQGRDPRADERVLELLAIEPERAGELAALMAGLERLPAVPRRRRAAAFVAASLAAAALLFALLRVDHGIAPAPPAATPPPVARLLAFRAEVETAGPDGTRSATFELEGGRVRERARRVERTFHDLAGAVAMRAEWLVETPEP